VPAPFAAEHVSAVHRRVSQTGKTQGSRETDTEPAAHMAMADKIWAGPGTTESNLSPHTRSIKETPRKHYLPGVLATRAWHVTNGGTVW